MSCVYFWLVSVAKSADKEKGLLVFVWLPSILLPADALLLGFWKALDFVSLRAKKISKATTQNKIFFPIKWHYQKRLAKL